MTKWNVFAHGLNQPLQWKTPHHIEVVDDIFSSMTDQQITTIFGVMGACPQHTFQVVTTDTKRMYDWFQSVKTYVNPTKTIVGHAASVLYADNKEAQIAFAHHAIAVWPLPNVWMGTSVENQSTANVRIPWLLRTPAAVRWVKYDPAIDLVDFTSICRHKYSRNEDYYDATVCLDWIVMGGECGTNARPFDVAWARSVIKQTQHSLCQVFVKQLGSHPVDGDALNANGLAMPWPSCTKTEANYPPRILLSDNNGGDPAEWPEDVRVQNLPKVIRG